VIIAKSSKYVTINTNLGTYDNQFGVNCHIFSFI